MVDPVNGTNATVQAVDTVAEQFHQGLTSALHGAHSQFFEQIIAHPFLFFITLVGAGFAVSYVFVFLCKTVIKAFTSRTETDLDDILLERLQHPVAWSLFLLFVSIALVPLSLSNILASVTNRLLISGNIFLVGVIVSRIIGTLIMHYGTKIAAETESTVDDHLLPIVRRIITVIVYVFAILSILSVWGVQVGPLLAGAGIAGIAFAFAMQESLKNIFGGVSLAFDRAYATGDRIKLADGTVGTVVDISLRSTKLRTADGDLVVVPNGKIANELFTTAAQPTSETRVTVAFGAAYGADVDAVKKVVLGSLKGIPHQIEVPSRELVTKVQFIEMGPSSLNFTATLWVDDYHYSWDAKLAATQRVYEALQKAKLEIPFPTQTVYVRK